MPSRQAPIPSLTLKRAISSDGQTIVQDRLDAGSSTPIVGLVSAYRYQGLRLSVRLGVLPGFRMVALSPQDVILPKRSITGSAEPPCSLMVVEPGDLGRQTLQDLVAVAHRHQLPLVWLGEPPIAQRLATASLPGGMIPPQSSIEQIERTLMAADVGLRVVHPDFSLVIDQTEPDLETGDALLDPAPSVLSPREQEVLTQVANGLPNKAIARKLGITDHTVKFHVSSVLTKLEAASRSEAVAIATRRGMISSQREP